MSGFPLTRRKQMLIPSLLCHYQWVHPCGSRWNLANWQSTEFARCKKWGWILQQIGIYYGWKELRNIPNIKPISDLRNYSDVLRDVAVGAPVFLTKNGRGRYAILDMRDFERAQATIQLMNELAKGRKSGEEKGWLTLEAVEKSLGIVNE